MCDCGSFGTIFMSIWPVVSLLLFAIMHPLEMRALSKLIFGGDKYYGQADGKLQGIYPGPAVLKMGMTGADFSNKNLGAGDAIIIAAWLATHSNKGAMTKFDISNSPAIINGCDSAGEEYSEGSQPW
jgi:hypothetical protein